MSRESDTPSSLDDTEFDRLHTDSWSSYPVGIAGESSNLLKSARAERTAEADRARDDFRLLVCERPAGCKLFSSDEFASVLEALPQLRKRRVSVLKAAIARVKARPDVRAIDTLIFERICIAAMGDLRHCFLLQAQIALEVGITQQAQVSRSLTRLRSLGLIFTHHEQRRLWIVPALLPLDFEMSEIRSRVA